MFYEIFENILACLLGVQMSLNHEKIEVKISFKIRDTSLQ